MTLICVDLCIKSMNSQEAYTLTKPFGWLTTKTITYFMRQLFLPFVKELQF